MRARKPSEYEKDGRMLGAHKDTMSSMFDNSANKSAAQKNELVGMLDDNKKNYDQQLYADWIMKIYDRCRVSCVANPAMNRVKTAATSEELDEKMSHTVEENERICGRNCLRKYDKTYKLYTNMEPHILQSYCEAEEIDQE